MSDKSVSLPDTPSWQADPYAGKSIQSLFDTGTGLTSGDFSNLGPLMRETIMLNPDISRLAIENMKAQLAPSYRTGRENLINTLEANNQLTGSTTGSSLANYENDYMSQLTAAGAQASINDINRALNARTGLYGTGLNAIQGAGGMALQNQSQMNQFALENYNNQVASALMNQDQSGGWLGGLLGSGGGALAGAVAGSVVPGIGTGIGALLGAGLGGAGGYFGSEGTGSSFLQSGAMLAGLKGFGGQTATQTPSVFSTSLRGETINNPMYDSLSKYGSSNTLANWYGG